MARSAILVASCLALSAPALAAPVDPGGTVSIAIEQRAPGSLQWDVYAYTAAGNAIGGLELVTTGFTAYQFVPVPNISLVDCTFGTDPDGIGYLLLNSDPGSFLPLGGSDDLDGLLLGTFTSAHSEPSSVGLYTYPGDSGPLSVSAPTGFPYPADQTVAVIVPEPAMLALLGIALAIGVMRRLRPAQHLPR